MQNRASKILNRLSGAPVVTVEPGFLIETRTSHGIHGEADDLAFSVEWRDDEGCQWAADFSEGALARARIARDTVCVRDFEGAEVVFQLYQPAKGWPLKTTTDQNQKFRLVCSECANTSRFVEVMAEETHLVDGQMNYIRLLDAIVDHYVCCECGAAIKPNVFPKQAMTMA